MRPLSSSPQQEQHMDDVFSATCVGSCGAVVHKCARFGFGCARCAQCAECRWPWRRFSASVLRSVRTFAECVGLCRRTRRASESVWRLGRVVRGSGKTAPERISAWGAKASPGAESGSFSVRREKWRLFRGRPGPSGGGFGDLAKSGAPAAILINAYSGDFCHPVLSNALAQEPLVYHSGTRELFSDIFGNTSKTDGTFSDIFGNFDFFDFFAKNAQKLKISAQNAQKTFFHVRACSRKRIFTNFLHMCKNISRHVANLQMCKWQMCKSANVQKTVVHKMRKSAAQIIFQMQKSQICTVHKNTNANFCTCHNFSQMQN